MNLLEKLFTQQLPIETDEDGNVFVGGVRFSPLEILKSDPIRYHKAFTAWKSDLWLPEQQEMLDQILEFDRNRNRFEDLCDAMQNGNVIPFVGSGMSCPSGLPTWSSFLRELRKDSKLTENELEELLAASKYEEAVDALVLKNTRGLFDEGIEHQLRVRSNEHIKGAVLLLPEIFQSFVITTNLDNILESIYEDSDRKFDYVLAGKEIERYPKLQSGRKSFLIKIHGDRNDHRSRVLSTKEYDEAYLPNSPIYEEFELIVRRNNLLFLGCSLGSDRTVQLVKETYAKYPRMQRHCAFLQKPSNEEDRLAREHFLTASGIFPIWYEYDHDSNIQSLLFGIMYELGVV
jgi:hypothetical protein